MRSEICPDHSLKFLAGYLERHERSLLTYRPRPTGHFAGGVDKSSHRFGNQCILQLLFLIPGTIGTNNVAINELN